MAQEQDEIVIIDEAEAAGFASTHEEQAATEVKAARKFPLIPALIFVLLAIITAAVVIIITAEEPPQEAPTFYDVESKLSEKEAAEPIESSRLEKMIAKANYLYTSGNKEEALRLYERIALYSEAISQYNLGVAQLKEEQYATALSTFKKAITKGENRCVSAINAAVCSLHLGNRDNFEYYIDLAHAYLPYESDSPLYSYYYALINYYKGNYLEALSALKHPTSSEYEKVQRQLTAKITALLGDRYAAISALESPYEELDAFSLGLLYANIGDLSLARNYLSDAIIQGTDAINEQLALSYVYIKSGQSAEGGKLLKTLTDMYGEQVYRPYPVRVFLKRSLFEPSAAQHYYRNNIAKKREFIYQKLFYFAPYKVFNAEQTISYIRKGNANIYIDDISSAKEYLKKSSHTSKINYGIAQAIQKALSFRLRDANTQLHTLLELYPKHSILNYNLGLTYAQMGDMVNAYKYFLHAYHLDANNYLAGIFAIMASDVTGDSNPKLIDILKENLSEESGDEEFEFYRTLLNIYSNNFIGGLSWLENDYEERPLYLMMKILIATQVDKYDIAQQASEKLSYLLPNDILPHLIYIETHFDELKEKAYAKSVQAYLNKQQLNYEDLYYGPYITRYLYTQTALMTGHLYPLRMQLKHKLETTTKSSADIVQSLALASLYNQEFEEAYVLYNQLIDDYKIRDPQTLFLGAVASTGSEHHANAIALMELAKMKNPRYKETRYALGLLYLQMKNNHGAAIQLQSVGNGGFVSEYFNFEIDTDALLFEKQRSDAQ